MKPYFKTDRGALYKGDCLEVMASFEEKSIDSLITDPPYGLKFMGKEWDYDVPKIEIWRECLRVLKPGAHAFIFAGSRTQHRMAVNVEDAGFILKDCFMWLYGSGFPKSTDISKQIDKHGGKNISWFGEWLKSWRKQNKVSQKEIAKLFPSKTGGLTGCVANWELGLNIPTAKQFSLICKTFNLPFESLAEAEREVIGKNRTGNPVNWFANMDAKDRGDGLVDITAPATPEAELWNGWGTHVKPAYEPILLAMKKNEGTYAQNALKHGVAGIHIDGGRVEYENISNPATNPLYRKEAGYKNKYGADLKSNNFSFKKGTKERNPNPKGRFPANVILDEEAAALLDRQSGVSQSRANIRHCSENENNCMSGKNYKRSGSGHQDAGGASRFFYTAKASASERNAGLYGMPKKEKKTLNEYAKNSEGRTASKSGSPSANFHPTIKPLKLMQWLCTLLKTPTGGIVLDPFGGSGTTALACHAVGIPWILIEREEKYCEIAARRIEAVASQKSFEDYL